MARETQEFLNRWKVKHRLSSAYHPSSNGRAELAVKSTKRLLRENIAPDGSLDTDKFVRAMLTKRNTPDADSRLSPAEILMGRKLNDSMPTIPKHIAVMSNPEVLPIWREAWAAREEAMRTKYTRNAEKLSAGAKQLKQLNTGDAVIIQNKYGRSPKRWERTGTVVEVRDFDQYIVKVHGSGRLTRRNRQFLRRYDQQPYYPSKLPDNYSSQEKSRKPGVEPPILPSPIPPTPSSSGEQAAPSPMATREEATTMQPEIEPPMQQGFETPRREVSRENRALEKLKDWNVKGKKENVIPATEGRALRSIKAQEN